MEVEKSTEEIKNDFTLWLGQSLKSASGISSYVRALDVLSMKIEEDVFQVKDVEYLNELYVDLIDNQRDPNGKYFSKKQPTLGANGFFSASIKKYLDFLSAPTVSSDLVKHSNSIFENFRLAYDSAGLRYSDSIITRFISSLITKPFVLLTGLSGSGKTKLAQSFAQWICQDKIQYALIPVGPDWTNREPLLGYPNSLESTKYVKPESGVLQLIMNAIDNPSLPFFLILDEMNLSHVERYFADFLSVMESKEAIKLHDDSLEPKSYVPHEVTWPSNLFLIGTVNIDETTYMFSPKVLDRANVIEFRVTESEISDFLTSAKEVTSLKGEGASMGSSFVQLARDKSTGNSPELDKELIQFFSELKKVGAEFGYRTALEIKILFNQIGKVNPEYSYKTNDKIDIAIMQKLLPKLHGSRRKLSKVIIALAALCYDDGDVTTEVLEREDVNFDTVNGKYPVSLEKLYRMYRSLLDNGFASYAEA